jgi:hypothetical protein
MHFLRMPLKVNQYTSFITAVTMQCRVMTDELQREERRVRDVTAKGREVIGGYSRWSYDTQVSHMCLLLLLA